MEQSNPNLHKSLENLIELAKKKETVNSIIKFEIPEKNFFAEK